MVKCLVDLALIAAPGLMREEGAGANGEGG